jgi:pimeloyl-ACP methyl ester carboxylesterase
MSNDLNSSPDASGESLGKGDAPGTGGVDEPPHLPPGPDFRSPGPFEVKAETGWHWIKFHCVMRYTRFAPVGETKGVPVILAHGFQGNRDSMAGWAHHLASWGLEVITPTLCHAHVLDPDHAQNGADLIALREHLELPPAIYAGYSVGGLAALFAAAEDDAAIAVLGLDMVDHGGLGEEVAERVTAPAHNLVAEPVECNESGNGVPVFGAAPQGRIVRVNEGDHCDFQNPGDWLCGLCAEPKDELDVETIQATIAGLSTAFLLWQAGLSPIGETWWFEGGAWFDELVASGHIRPAEARPDAGASAPRGAPR